jgi:hypothetical protein
VKAQSSVTGPLGNILVDTKTDDCCFKLHFAMLPYFVMKPDLSCCYLRNKDVKTLLVS